MPHQLLLHRHRSSDGVQPGAVGVAHGVGSEAADAGKLLRVFLFWIPALTVSVFCIAIVALVTYLVIRVSYP